MRTPFSASPSWPATLRSGSFLLIHRGGRKKAVGAYIWLWLIPAVPSLISDAAGVAPPSVESDGHILWLGPGLILSAIPFLLLHGASALLTRLTGARSGTVASDAPQQSTGANGGAIGERLGTTELLPETAH
jgi:hypothetical protein